jgi:hypothetical protein
MTSTLPCGIRREIVSKTVGTTELHIMHVGCRLYHVANNKHAAAPGCEASRTYVCVEIYSSYIDAWQHPRMRSHHDHAKN